MPAVQVLIVDSSVWAIIASGETHLLQFLVRSGSATGVISMDQALADLIHETVGLGSDRANAVGQGVV